MYIYSADTKNDCLCKIVLKSGSLKVADSKRTVMKNTYVLTAVFFRWRKIIIDLSMIIFVKAAVAYWSRPLTCIQHTWVQLVLVPVWVIGDGRKDICNVNVDLYSA